jgi:hypothetical protein
MKSSSTKNDQVQYMFLLHLIPVDHPFPLALQAIILTKVLRVGMMKCTIHLFLFWLTLHSSTGARK